MGTQIHRWTTWGLSSLLVSMAFVVSAANDLDPLRAQFQLSDEKVDYAVTKLLVDHLIDPTTDIATVRRQLDEWELAVQGNLPTNPSAPQALDALLKTLYEPGPWNQGQPFSYDLTDPLGRKPVNKRLATYLATRKGNCVSMPILVAILGQRLGLPITLSTAPEHIMATLVDDAQQEWIYIEATGGGYKRRESYILDTKISPAALNSEIYLRPLRPSENVGVIASTLMEHYALEGNSDGLMEVTTLALTANPKDTVAMIWKANAYYLQIQERYQRKYPNPNDIPEDKVTDFKHLSRENLVWFEKAEALGWGQKTPEQDEAYLQSIQYEKMKGRQ